jgi:hypothetical protein
MRISYGGREPVHQGENMQHLFLSKKHFLLFHFYMHQDKYAQIQEAD